MKKIIFVAIAMLAISCSNNEPLADLSNDEIRVIANMPTRATMTAFEQGDKMGLYAVEYNGDVTQPLQISGNYLNNEPMVYNGSEWKSERTLYWNSNACDFYGIYPYQQMTAVEDILFEVATDQNTSKSNSSLGGYEASDLMWAKAEKVKQSDKAVKLQFNHMMSRLVVKIEKGPSFEGEIPDDIVTHIYNTATTAKVNYKVGSLEKYALSDNKTITMRKINNTTFDAIVVPQFIERSTPLVEITMGGIAYLLNYSISFRPGYQHIITVTLNTSPDQEKIEIAIDGEVGGWN
jgi:hypothetical protein